MKQGDAVVFATVSSLEAGYWEVMSDTMYGTEIDYAKLLEWFTILEK